MDFFPFQQVPCCATAGSTQINCLTRLSSFIIVYIKCLGVRDATQVGPAAVLQRGEEGGVLLGGDRHQGRGGGGGGWRCWWRWRCGGPRHLPAHPPPVRRGAALEVVPVLFGEEGEPVQVVHKVL